jgi:hypothetical protein
MDEIELNDNQDLERFFWKYFDHLRPEYRIIDLSIAISNSTFYIIIEGATNIHLLRDPFGELGLSIGRCGINNDWRDRTSLDTIIYFLSKRKDRVSMRDIEVFDTPSQMSLLSLKLSEYLEQIESLFCKKDFSTIQKKLDKVYVELMEKDMDVKFTRSQDSLR